MNRIITTRPTPETRRNSGWMVDALCAQTGGDLWFSPNTKDHTDDVADAKSICGKCHVQTRCLEYALLNDERYGIWGGLTDTERERLRHRMNLPPAPEPEDWHGTEAGAKRHYRAGEQPCWECRVAALVAKREQRRRTAK